MLGSPGRLETPSTGGSTSAADASRPTAAAPFMHEDVA